MDYVDDAIVMVVLQNNHIISQFLIQRTGNFTVPKRVVESLLVFFFVLIHSHTYPQTAAAVWTVNYNGRRRSEWEPILRHSKCSSQVKNLNFYISCGSKTGGVLVLRFVHDSDRTDTDPGSCAVKQGTLFSCVWTMDGWRGCFS